MAAYELTKTILKDSANLKAYYRFESGALTTDGSGNSHTLTAIATPTEDASGKYGGAVAYASASSQAHSAVDGADFKPTGNFSISAWIKTSTTGTQKVIFTSWAAATSKYAGIEMQIDASNKINIYSGKNSGVVEGTDLQKAVSATSVTDGNWHHVVGTWDGSTLRAYVDGKMDGSAVWANAPVYQATNYVRVGCANDTGTNYGYFNGSIDDLAFFNGTALSADQIKELYEGRYIGEWMPQTNLVGLWHLNGSSTDTSGNNNHGTDTTITYGSSNGRMGTQGASLNGTASKIVLTDASPLKPTGSYTVSAWVNATGFAATTRGIFHTQSQNTSVAGISLFCTSGGALKLQQGNNTGTVAGTNYRELTGATLSTGAWYWICGVYDDGNTMKLYVNGAESATVANAIDPAYAATTYIRIGCQNDTGTDKNFWNGKIDEVAIFSRALTAAEIRHWYAWSVGKYL